MFTIDEYDVLVHVSYLIYIWWVCNALVSYLIYDGNQYKTNYHNNENVVNLTTVVFLREFEFIPARVNYSSSNQITAG